ncbi:T9SS type A sorting domain-containing protein [Microvirga sp. STS02]|uniref:T9SS type A sorting domain-containing protein n=1 Tax=Hymenobacter negativus TaxID=2795026 RepID=UPI0018DE9CCA|nr:MULTISPECIES: T9SS type A sorting domain-containing protein [Bacteria]MBH8570232.1 T9SS type A sorting domain-containing protein [Hymenobacter negativus]MBR7209971.1 T9SS type A sorting domain-containing protein [Microvirga sp. STS02]
MKKIVLSALMALAAVAVAAPQALAQTTCPAAPTPIVVSGSITANTTWTNNNIYLLQGFVFVEAGATLTIQPGTIIKGDQASKGTLTIKQGARIDARGTATQPIVFTSNQPAGSRARGDWGGLIILGRATQNIPGTAAQPLPKIEGGLTPDTYFGGNDDNDNSGTLQYVRIEFPGVAFTTDNEINGLTLGGVGAGTTIDHIQVSYSGDDSYEWFGGAVNAKYLIAFRGIDDEWDTDNGFHGKVQFGVSLRDPNVADASGSNAFESDNDANGSNNSPQTSAIFSNMSNFVAPTSGTLNTNYKRAMHIRRNSALSIFNSVVAGYPVGLLLDEGTAPFSATNSAVNAAAGTLALKNNVFAGFARNAVATRVNGSTYNVKQFLGANNDTTSTVASLSLNANNFNLTAPGFVPAATSPLGSGASFTDAKLSNAFFTPVTYRGAFAPAGTPNADWTAGWTNFNPQITCYNLAGQTLAAKAAADKSLELGVYPNPVAGAGKLSFTVATATTATVRVLDATGRLVATVAAGQKLAAGPQLIALPAGLKPGLYVATVATAETTQSVRFVVAQ